MGTMNNMRENTGVVLWILVFAFGVIWVLQDSGGLDAVGVSGGTDVAVVDGDAITYQDYIQNVDQQVQQFQQQSGQTMPPQMLEQQRDQIFQQMVENKLREHEMDRLGITVTDEEIYDMVMGDNPHPIIRSYFGDEAGNVNRALLQSFINNPEAQQDWIQIEQYLRSVRRAEKMENLIGATVRVTDQDVLDEYRRRNLRLDVEWVGLRYASIPNDSVTVTEADLENFYEEQREDYARSRTYSIRYVTRSTVPTAADTAAVFAELERLKPTFAAAEDDSVFVTRNASQLPFSDEWLAAPDLDPEIAEAVFPNPEVGAVLGPISAGGRAHLVKLRDVRPADNEVVHAQHILLRSPEEDADIRQTLVDVRNQITSGETDFESMARQYSQDGSASEGGDLGWFARGQMVAPFEDAAFSASIGQVVGPIKTQIGYHLIRVNARAAQEVKVADFALDIRTDVATLNDIQDQLDDLVYYAGESGNFNEEAERLGLTVQQVQVEEGQQFIPVLGNSRAILTFLESADEGDISSVIELNDVFVVAYVDDIVPEGYRPFEEVRAEVEPRVYVDKKKELLGERLRSAYASAGFDGLPQALGTEIQTATDLGFGSNVIPGLGAELKFVGTAMGLDEGETSRVIEGRNAAYILRVIDVEEPTAITEAQRETIRQQLLQQRRGRIQNSWLTSLREAADISDYRSRFQQ
ncbi:MAG: peptidyl-prolyl cis-trans isomerase [Rhodothermales bacterium]